MCTEIDEQHIALLNSDWNTNPSVKHACAQLLAGSILVDIESFTVVIANTVKVYERTRTVEIHKEAFDLDKNQPKDTSHPDSNSHYQNIKSVALNGGDGKKTDYWHSINKRLYET